MRSIAVTAATAITPQVSFRYHQEVESDPSRPLPSAAHLAACIGASLAIHFAAVGLLAALSGPAPPDPEVPKGALRVTLPRHEAAERPALPESAREHGPPPVASGAPDKASDPPQAAGLAQTQTEPHLAPLSTEAPSVLELPRLYIPSRELDVKPRPKDEILPIYPEQAREREASVVLRLFISETGRVDRIEVVSESLDPAYAQSAIEAFGQANFLPGRKSGVAVKSEMQIVVDFRESRQGMKPPN
jgi:TonB family protein